MATAEAPVVVTPALLREVGLPEPGHDKHSSGRVVVVGGSSRSPGGVRLAAEAALRVGAGKVTVASTAAVLRLVASDLPEAALVALPADPADDDHLDPDGAQLVASEADGAGALLLGPGLVHPDRAAALTARLVPEVSGPVLLDGLGSAFLTEHPDGLHHLAGRAVLSVNPGELAHTAGVDVEEVAADPVTVATSVARRSRVVVLCAAATKHVVAPDGQAWVVAGGGPGLASSGSGDVQAGALAGLLARGASPVDATLWAAYAHARCGERLAAAVGRLGYLARELPSELPRVLDEVG